MNFNSVIWTVSAIALQGLTYYQGCGVARFWATEGMWDQTGSTNHVASSAIQGQLCGLKQGGGTTNYTGRFPESKQKPGLGMKPFIVISVFVKSVARSDKPLFSSSKC